MRQRSALPPGPPRLPDPTSVDVTNADAVQKFLVSLTSTLATQLSQRPVMGMPQERRVFTSPNGTTFDVTVADDGTITATERGSTQYTPVPPV